MPQGEFHRVQTSDITVHREDRQRRDLGDLTGLKDSIKRLGLIHPIVITRDYILVSGERRFACVKSLGWTHVPIQFEDEADLDDVEYDENEYRLNLSWQEKNDRNVRKYERLRQEDPTSSDTAIATKMGIGQETLSNHLIVKKERLADPRLNDEKNFHAAKSKAYNNKQRRAWNELQNIHMYSGGIDTHQPILHTNFHEWAPSYSGPKFNLIHCDFPYGIDSQDSGVNPSGYDDSLDIFLQLLRTLVTELDRFCTPQAHMIFWFSPKHWSTTWENLKLLDGFTFDDVPLVWHKSDGKGIAPDPGRRPRRVYETAFFGWRGDRKLVRLKDNLFSAPSVSGRHPHEKSELALRHFFEMVVDSGTAILDPTCGSGSALRAARALGASRYLGLERDEETANDARRILEQSDNGSGI